ncbi:MAG TPA: hypothetical protein VF588_09895 [Pyrinomonadaceae bacterium]|jgi:hypothetical protein
MRRTFYASTLALLLAAAALAQTGGAQNSRRAPAPPRTTPVTATTRAQTPNTVAPLPLPASDMIFTLDARRLLTEVVPRALASDTARLAQVNADVDEFKSRTGIDARAFDTVAVGARIVALPSGAVKIDHLTAVARGTFTAASLVASARAAAKGGLAEQTHGGKTVYVATVNDQLKLFGLARMRVRELAFAVLDPNTLALGEPADVRAAIDAQAGRGRADMSLLDFPRGAGDFAAFAGNVRPGVLAGVRTELPNVDRAIDSIRGFYGTVGSSPTGIQLLTTLRTGATADAKQLSDTVDALRQIAPGLIPAGDKGRFARALVDSLKITTKGAEVQFRLEVPQADISTLLKAL